LRKKLVVLRRFGTVDPLNHIGKIFKGIMAMPDSGSHKGIDHSAPFGTLLGAGEQVVFPAQSNSTDGIFYQIIINFQATILEVAFQEFPAAGGISDCLADVSTL